ncbi:MAG: tetratricopeptide repeat protein [Nitrospira sp.]|nr:tetratricopeptide repeat protein [Nitrospira sp.]
MEIHKLIQIALEHYQNGNFKQSEEICRTIIELQPENAFVLNFLGVLLYQQGNYDSAIDYIKKALQFDPYNPDSYDHLGSALKANGRLDEAIMYYQKAIGLKPHSADIYFNLGNTFVMKRQLDEAIVSYREAVKLNPDFSAAYNNLGNVLKEKKQYDAAIANYQMTIEINPDLADAYYNLGNIYQEKGEYDKAAMHYQKTLKVIPSHFDSCMNLGTVFNKQGKLDEAIKFYQKAIELNANFAGSYYNLGVALQDQGDIDNALQAYKKTIELDPDFAEAHFSISLINLLLGNFKEGWKGYEWRWKLKEAYQRNFYQPMWDGSDIKGKTILLHAEQGFGDTIQFIRYAPLVAQRGVKVIVECQKELTSLFKNVEGIHQVISHGESLPYFDVRCPLLSLPAVFDTTTENIPAKIPYIAVEMNFIDKWRKKVEIRDSQMKIGLAWAGRATARKESYRACSLEMFAPFARLSNVIFYSLQKGKASEQTVNSPFGMKLIDYTKEIEDFSDTAGLMYHLDIVISVDTAVAHLAGALGKPVWTLIPFAPDWRWSLNRDDCPWYPTMRLFRQTAPGDWSSVIDKIYNELQRLIQKKG